MTLLSILFSVVFLSLTFSYVVRAAQPRISRIVKRTSAIAVIASVTASVMAMGGVLIWDAQNSAYAQSGDDENFEIIKSTDSRVWRLNKKTGEVSVCTLTGDQLVCTDSENAATPPKKTYEDIQSEAEAEQEKRDADARAEQERQLTILDRFLDMIRELIHMSMGETAASEK